MFFKYHFIATVIVDFFGCSNETLGENDDL